MEAKDVREAEPSWLDNFAAFLRREVSILVIIGIAGWCSAAPGLIVLGVIAAICFVLFFQQTQLGGQLIYLAIMLFLPASLGRDRDLLIPASGSPGKRHPAHPDRLALAGLDRPRVPPTGPT